MLEYWEVREYRLSLVLPPISKLQLSMLSIHRLRHSQVEHEGMGLTPNGSNGRRPKRSQVECDSGTLL